MSLISLVVVTVVPASDRPVTGIQHDLEHFLAFALVACFLQLAIRPAPSVLHSAEQLHLDDGADSDPTTTRHARLEDFVFDTLAAWIGTGLIHFSQKIQNSRRPKAG
jgi:hypothetical protein